MEDTCICCGATIPEGRQVCPACEASVKNFRLSTEAALDSLDDILQDLYGDNPRDGEKVFQEEIKILEKAHHVIRKLNKLRGNMHEWW